MLGFHVESIEEVNRLHTKGIKLGGVSEGEPKIRSNMHSAYIRDLDNNKICIYTSNA
jgi:predicted lactoylglutathione lyase